MPWTICQFRTLHNKLDFREVLRCGHGQAHRSSEDVPDDRFRQFKEIAKRNRRPGARRQMLYNCVRNPSLCTIVERRQERTGILVEQEALVHHRGEKEIILILFYYFFFNLKLLFLFSRALS